MLSFIGGWVLLTVLMIVNAFIRGFVTVKLWAWFVVPAFGLPLLTYIPAAGLALLMTYFAHQFRVTDLDVEQDLDYWVKVVLHMFINPATVLYVGWILTLFV